ncbi:hypothetical protein [Pelomonas aquatica]|nr:hypothetical protein [Pelomonas aquatica]MCY4757390.1 hypothetical protein [Pelomonas aquatica]MDG0865395.1 hypothetical protein [Pelomonas aquatica]
MKEQDHHSVVTHWGGRQERYREFKRTQNRAHDPFGVQPLQFGSDLHYEAWVLERFSPTTKSLTRKPTDVKAVIAGTDRSAKATFVVTRRDDSVDYVFVAKTDASTPAMRALGKIAAANGAQVIVRTRAEIRTRADEFWWWEKLRQVAVLWVRKGSEYDDALVALVATGNRTLAEL